jgi:peptidoglycan pentaglycine glycine transferase (the first glycine)
MTNTLQIATITTAAEWNALLRQFPTAHILQTWEWGAFKQDTGGWQPLRLAFLRDGQAVALVSLGIRHVGPLCLMYAPKGPLFLGHDSDVATFVLDTLQRLAAQRRAIWLKIDPDIALGYGAPQDADAQANPQGEAWQADLLRRGWRFSSDQVQFRNTMTVDLTQSEDALLAAMNQGTRRKIRIAERDGVTIRATTAQTLEADIDILYTLYQATSARDGFLIRPREYYAQAWRNLFAADMAQPLIAEVDGQAVAHVILLHVGQTCWYFYGASGEQHRDKMPNYLLQWQAMRWSIQRGYHTYDLWGAPNEFTETDSMWGVYQFKRGLRARVVRTGGAWDYAPYPWLYRAYTELMPRVMRWLRRRMTHGDADTASTTKNQQE